jgi:hypothetical protein
MTEGATPPLHLPFPAAAPQGDGGRRFFVV